MPRCPRSMQALSLDRKYAHLLLTVAHRAIATARGTRPYFRHVTLSVRPRLTASNPSPAKRERKLGSSPGPVVIQRRAEAARHARASATLLRVGVLLVADVLALSIGLAIVDVVVSTTGASPRFTAFFAQLLPQDNVASLEVLCAVALGLALLRNYGPGPQRQNAGRLFAGLSLGLTFVVWSSFWDGISPLGALGFFVAVVFLGTLLVADRAAVDYFVNAVRPRAGINSRAIVVGSRECATEVMARDHVGRSSRFLVVGFVGPDGGTTPQSLGGIDDLVWILERYAIDTVMIADGLDAESLLAVLEVCDRTGCTALSVSPHFPVGGFIPRVVSRGATPYVELIRPSLRAPQLAIKRAFDIVFATILLIILSPLLMLVAIAVRVSSPGRVIFAQSRVGYAGRIFTMYKFRTMVEDAEKARDSLRAESLYEDARVFKIRNDPRVTPLGRILRRTSMDELPQLWNVLRGEMSLVGPRPPLANEVAEYEEEHYTRFDMKPGITGPWQVAGRNEVTRFEEILALDAAYLTDWTIAKDFMILLRTIPAVLTMRGAM